ncbi:MAG: valine--tRNA ligase, partial [Candidatus Izemoplasmataceae bacterium]
MDMEKKYAHKRVEEGKYAFWRDSGFFKSGDKGKEPYTIVIPPPNVTGKLHLGHAWDNTMQDILIRKKRMEGYDALYLPGMDHAGIATQAKIDARLREQGIDRFKIGREAFLEEAWAWKKEYADFIRDQWAALGISVDYDKERFTLDEGLNDAVNHVFISLYEKGLIYRKERIINWDVQAKTALSNIEVEHEEVEGALYYFKYLLEDDPDDYILIATTRPETIFADTALVVHPADKKRSHYIGKKVLIPGTDRAIPVYADDYVDREFGTGALKVTPAHDPNDFEIGERHNLDMPLCMDEDGRMNALAGQYEGMDRFKCRNQVVEDLKAEGLMTKVEKHVHNVGHSERTGVMVEPRLSKQWFVKMDPLASQALEKSTAEFVPPRFEKIFKRWMENIQDWCISRQLWWGHRIPAYYGENGEVYVGTNPPEGYVQDEDVLDTWFSSALWPFSTLGWPEETADFKRYYPTDTMVTGYDIIFFWVARMIFQGIEFTGKTPFKHVLIHGLIRDAQGRKMSKSLGNGVDPMDIKDEYGIDTLRYFLTTNSAPGQDLRFEIEKVESSWNYINKLWNISRFLLMHIEDMKEEEAVIDKAKLELKDRTILARLQETIREVDRNYEAFEFGEAARALYTFTWDEFASWYVEMSKLTFKDGDEATIKNTKAVVYKVWVAVMKMLHPFMPFMTEEIYQKLPFKDRESIMVSDWVQAEEAYDDKRAIEDAQVIKTLIQKVRHVRNTYQLPYQEPLHLKVECNTATKTLLENERKTIESFINPEPFEISETVDKGKNTLSYVTPRFTAHIP